jgi:hypothetical protein
VIGAKSKDPVHANHNEVSYREFLRGIVKTKMILRLCESQTLVILGEAATNGRGAVEIAMLKAPEARPEVSPHWRRALAKPEVWVSVDLKGSPVGATQRFNLGETPCPFFSPPLSSNANT